MSKHVELHCIVSGVPQISIVNPEGGALRVAKNSTETNHAWVVLGCSIIIELDEIMIGRLPNGQRQGRVRVSRGKGA